MFYDILPFFLITNNVHVNIITYMYYYKQKAIRTNVWDSLKVPDDVPVKHRVFPDVINAPLYLEPARKLLQKICKDAKDMYEVHREMFHKCVTTHSHFITKCSMYELPTTIVMLEFRA